MLEGNVRPSDSSSAQKTHVRNENGLCAGEELPVGLVQERQGPPSTWGGG